MTDEREIDTDSVSHEPSRYWQAFQALTSVLFKFQCFSMGVLASLGVVVYFLHNRVRRGIHIPDPWYLLALCDVGGKLAWVMTVLGVPSLLLMLICFASVDSPRRSAMKSMGMRCLVGTTLALIAGVIGPGFGLAR